MASWWWPNSIAACWPDVARSNQQHLSVQLRWRVIWDSYCWLFPECAGTLISVNMPIVDHPITFAHMGIRINDGPFVSVKQGQRSLNSVTCIFVNYKGLSEIAEVNQGTDGHNKFFGSGTSNCSNDILLDITMLSSCTLQSPTGFHGLPMDST
jgi:hypothetical protein